MTTTLFLEAFGHLSPHQAVIMVEEEDLYSVFYGRAELMGWSTMDISHQPLFWDMHEAELTAGQGLGRIGWVQVGLASRIVGIAPIRPPRTPGWAAWPEIRHNTVTSAQVVPAFRVVPVSRGRAAAFRGMYLDGLPTDRQGAGNPFPAPSPLSLRPQLVHPDSKATHRGLCGL